MAPYKRWRPKSSVLHVERSQPGSSRLSDTTRGSTHNQVMGEWVVAYRTGGSGERSN